MPAAGRANPGKMEKKKKVAAVHHSIGTCMGEKSILIVEDEQIAAIDLRETLLSLGYSVTGIAKSGEQAVAMVDANVPDLILMDICLAGEMDGIEAARTILERHEVPVIFITAYADADLINKAKEVRPYGYIIKPYDERTRQLAEAHEEIRRSEEKYRLLFEQGNDAIFVADAKTRRLVDCNRKAEDLTGWSRPELLSLSADDLHPEDIRKRTMEDFRAFREGQVTSIESEVITRTGKRVPVSINAAPVEIHGHLFLMGIFRDITWQKAVEQEIHEKTEELDQYFFTGLDLFCIADTQGYFRRLNPEWERALGYTLAELQGKKFLDYVHPDDMDATLRAMETLTAQVCVTNFVNRYRHKDGSYRWIEWRSVPKGERIFAAARDITRHHLEEYYSAGLSRLKQELLITAPLRTKLEKLTDARVSLFSADFARIWITGPADLCEKGCIHAGLITEPGSCRSRAACLHLMVSSGRYTHTDGGHRRVPIGAYKIGRIAEGEESRLITNDVQHDPRVHDHAWAASLGLASFEGFRLTSADGKPVGVLAFFSRQRITPEMTGYLEDLATTTSQGILTATAEDALRESDERFRRLLSRSFDAVVVHQDARIVMVNESAVRIMGAASPAELIGKPVIELVHPDFRGTVAARVREMQGSPGGTVPLMEEKFLKLDGTTIPVTVIATGTTHNGKNAVIVVFRDITGEKKAEEELRKSEEKFRAIFNSTFQFTGLMTPDGILTEVNETALDFIGITREEVVNLPFWETPWWKGDERRVQRLKDTIRQAASCKFVRYEEVLRGSGGRILHVDCSIKPVTDTGGTVKLLIPEARDISARKKAEEALRESEEKLRAILDNIQDMVYRADLEGKFLMVSPSGARLLGFESPEQLRGLPVKEVYANPDERDVFLAVLREKVSVYGYPLVLKSRNGTLLHVVASSHFFFDPAGNILGVEGVLHDVTELRQAEESLRAANNKLNLLSSITRHDIRNQLMALDGYIQLSTNAIGNADKLREYFSREYRIARNIERQINFTHDYENLGVKSPVWQNVSTLAAEVSVHLPLQNIQLSIDCSGCQVFADPLLEKVFYNLIDNSLHYGGQKMTTIRITAQQKEHDLRLVYEDDGEGINPPDKTLLFTRGFGKHTGLGLFLSREILALTGITIRETGEAGKGARFEITVPEGAFRITGYGTGGQQAGP